MTLASAIEALYAAFSDVPRPERIDGCPCCIDRKVSSALHTKRLRELTPDELSDYGSSALLTVGTIEDYLYFLPRILEISASHHNWWPDPAVTGRVIRDTGLCSWPTHRRQALEDFLTVLMEDLVSRNDGVYEIDGWMCAIARMGLDVRPFLDIIAMSDDQILAWYDWKAGPIHRRKLSNSFWELPNEGHDRIVEWFTRPPASEVIHRAYGVVFAG